MPGGKKALNGAPSEFGKKNGGEKGHGGVQNWELKSETWGSKKERIVRGRKKTCGGTGGLENTVGKIILERGGLVGNDREGGKIAHRIGEKLTSLREKKKTCGKPGHGGAAVRNH